jgi:hypothetical protein
MIETRTSRRARSTTGGASSSVRAAATTLLLQLLLAVSSGALAADLPPGLASPKRGVVCNGARGVCYDRFGPSIGLTELFLGKRAAERLLVALRESPPDHGRAAVFSPAEGVECRRESGPCRRAGGEIHAALSALLYAKPSRAPQGTADQAALVGIDWDWRTTRYGNDKRSQPKDPTRYRLRLEADGSVRVIADCDQVVGRYRVDGSAIVIEVLQPILPACGPSSLHSVFLRDLAAAAIFFVRNDGLYLDLQYDGGTMEFGRHAPGEGDEK